MLLRTGVWSSLFGLPVSGPAQAFAGEFDPVSVVDEPVQDGVGVGRVAYNPMPAVHGKLGRDHRGAATVALFEDFQEIVTGGRVERLQPPIVEDQEIGAAETAHEAGMTAIAARERQLLEQPRDALVENRPIVAAGLVAEGRRQPTLPDAGRADKRQIVVSVDPASLDELLEQGAIEAAGGPIVDILDAGLLAQPGDPQPCCEPLVLPPRGLSIEEKSEPFERAETIGLPACGEVLEGLGHSLEAERVKLVESGMFEQGVSPSCSSAAHGCWDAGSASCPWAALRRGADRDGCRGWI